MRPPIHPGEVLADKLAELNITPTELARQIAVPANGAMELSRPTPPSPALPLGDRRCSR
jgi:plasmid maintenance system antidote protein VapI